MLGGRGDDIDDAQDELMSEAPERLEALPWVRMILELYSVTHTTKLSMIHPAPRADTIETKRITRLWM